MAILIPFSEGEPDADAHLQRMGSRLPLKGDRLSMQRADPIQFAASQEALSERCRIYKVFRSGAMMKSSFQIEKPPCMGGATACPRPCEHDATWEAVAPPIHGVCSRLRTFFSQQGTILSAW